MRRRPSLLWLILLVVPLVVLALDDRDMWRAVWNGSAFALFESAIVLMLVALAAATAALLTVRARRSSHG